jgi:hypothetical protein
VVPTYRGFSVLISINMPVAEILHHDKVIEVFGYCTVSFNDRVVVEV